MTLFCGISLRANTCTIVLLKNSDTSLKIVATSKIDLGDDRLQQQLITFRETAKAFFAVHKVKTALVKGRMQAGKFSGGFASSKMEAIIQSIDTVLIEIIAPQTIAAFLKKDHAPIEDFALFKYFHEAFEVAYLASQKSEK